MKKILFTMVAVLAFNTPALAGDEDDIDTDKSSQHLQGQGQRLGFGHSQRQGFGHSERRGFEHRRDGGWNDDRYDDNDRYHYDDSSADRYYRNDFHISRRDFWILADRNRDGYISEKEYRHFYKYYVRRDFNSGYANGWHNGWRW